MAQIYNSELTDNLIRGIKAAVSRDNIPTQLAEKVVPVIDVHPNHNKFTQGVLLITATNSATASTAFPTNKQCYVTGVQLGYIKDATSTSTFSDVKVVLNGLATNIARIPTLTLTAGAGSIFISFDRPIKVDLNTSAYVDNSTAVANVTAMGLVHYYYEETN